MSVEERVKKQVQLLNYQWRHRRRMAWTAFISILIVTFLCMFIVDIERLGKLETVVTWFYMAMASIVGAYMGFATYASINGGQQNYMPDEFGDAYNGAPEESAVVPDNPDAPVPKKKRIPKAGPSSFE